MLLPDGLVDSPPNGPAVYFLFRADVCVYVGASARPRRRVAYHRRAGRQFDRAAYLPVSNEQMSATERQWIAAVCPAHNGVGNPKADPTAEKWGLLAGGWATFKLSPTAVAILDAAVERMGWSRTEVVEHLIRTADLTPGMSLPAGAFPSAR